MFWRLILFKKKKKTYKVTHMVDAPNKLPLFEHKSLSHWTGPPLPHLPSPQKYANSCKS